MSRGISLLEVLVAIFVTAVGLLAVASLIPIGSFQIGEANKSIRGWDLAQAAFRQIEVGEMLKPRRWVDGGGFPAPAPGSAFVIDPYYFARNGGIWATPITDQPECWFPYRSDDDAGQQQNFPYPYQMPRLSLNAWPGAMISGIGKVTGRQFVFDTPEAAPAMFAEPFNDGNSNGVHDAGEPFRDLPIVGTGNNRWDDRSLLAEKMFTGHDDTSFAASDDAQRPVPVNMTEPFNDLDSNGQWDIGEPFTDLNANGTWDNQSHVQTSVGDYSWMITGEFDQFPSNPGNCSISVVVFYKRAVTFAPAAPIPGERTVFVDLQDGLKSGGRSALLYYTASTPEMSDYLNVKDGTWIMLSGKDASTGRHVLRWYRIVNTGSPEDDPPIAGQPQVRRRRVTLAGPDVDARLNGNLLIDQRNGPSDPRLPSTNFPTLYATFVGGVVNVFQRTVKIER